MPTFKQNLGEHEANTNIPLDLNGQVEKTSEYYIAIGEHSDLYTGRYNGNYSSKSAVAIKVLRGATSTQTDFLSKLKLDLRTSAKIWKQLDHPHVAFVYGITDDLGPLPAIVSTYYPNGNIVDYTKKMNCLPDKRLELVKEVADGLNYLHTRDPPVIHGDLRGNNVLISVDGHAVLSDFGLSFIIQSSDFTSVKTAGTCRWTAPEIMNPPEDSSPDAPSVPYSLAGDIYAYAMTVLEIFTGKPPFHEKKNDSAVIFMVIDGKRPDIPDDIAKQRKLQQIMERCWDQEPSERLPAAEVLRLLDEVNVSFLRWIWSKVASYLPRF